MWFWFDRQIPHNSDLFLITTALSGSQFKTVLINHQCVTKEQVLSETCASCRLWEVSAEYLSFSQLQWDMRPAIWDSLAKHWEKNKTKHKVQEKWLYKLVSNIFLFAIDILKIKKIYSMSWFPNRHLRECNKRWFVNALWTRDKQELKRGRKPNVLFLPPTSLPGFKCVWKGHSHNYYSNWFKALWAQRSDCVLMAAKAR